MALFIMAMTINPSAKKLHSKLPGKINESLEVFTENKIKVNDLFATLGRYDFLAVFDAVDQTTAFRIASGINNKGILETETWPIVSYDDFSQLLAQ
ncbi:MAG: GYD domain-containing protein [candidate division Zixibacteria bacterium]|nr:GYD domain-containing protein [candidate division Zixibacteria bacterium]